jgi:hypothetical protein
MIWFDHDLTFNWQLLASFAPCKGLRVHDGKQSFCA